MGEGPDRDAPRLRVLVLTDVFPNPRHPTEGLFVRERTLALARSCDVRILAPVPWMLWRGRPRFYLDDRIPRTTRCGTVEVHHPRWFYVPRYGKALDGFLLFLSILPAVRRLRRTFDFEVIQANWILPTGLAAVLLGRWFHRPVEVTLRGMIGLLLRERARAALMRGVLRRAARVNAVSPNLLDAARSLGADPAKLRLVPNGVNHRVFRPMERDAARATCGLPPRDRVVITVGNLNPRKGQDRVLRALAGLRGRHPNVRCVLAGGAGYEADETRALRRLAAELGLEDRVRFLGTVAPEELRVWLAASDVLCLASAFEGWPNVLLEAMACGRPVVTSDVGAARLIVPREEVGLVYTPWDSLEALEGALDRALSRTWDEDAITAHARRHTWDRTAGILLETLREAAAAAGAPSEGGNPGSPQGRRGSAGAPRPV